MSIFKQSGILFISLCMASGSLFATTPGFYAGVKGGFSWVSFDDQSANQTDLGVTGSVLGLDAGYNFNRYVGVELGYNQMLPMSIYGLFGNKIGSAKMHDINLLAAAYLPLSSAFDLFLKAGAAYVSASATPAGDSTDSEGYFSPKAQVGFDCIINKHFSLNLSYARDFKNGKQLDGISVGGQFNMALIGLDYSF